MLYPLSNIRVHHYFSSYKRLPIRFNSLEVSTLIVNKISCISAVYIICTTTLMFYVSVVNRSTSGAYKYDLEGCTANFYSSTL